MKMSIKKRILRFLSVLLIKYLQKKYKSISINNQSNQSNQVISKLLLIQSILYYFKCQFQPWGYFQPKCHWSRNGEKEFNELFPIKEDFKELEVVVWHNPEAVTYYQNEIFKLSHQSSYHYASEIKDQLKKWDKWN